MRTTITLLAAIAAVSLTACQDRGPAEKAGEEIDEAVENVADEGKNLGNDVEDAMDEVRDGVEDAAEEVEEGVEDAVDEVQDP